MKLTDIERKILGAIAQRPMTRGDILEVSGLNTHPQLNPVIDNLYSKGLIGWREANLYRVWHATESGIEVLKNGSAAEMKPSLSTFSLGPK